MNIKLVKCEAPNFQKVNFSCDCELSKKLNDFPMTRDHLNKFNTTLFIGTQGSGKTSLLVNFVKKLYKKVFDKIKNDKKEIPNHPDYKGNITVNGQDFWLSAWIKEGKGGKFMGLALSPKDQQAPQKAKPKSSGFDDMPDDVPF